MAGLGSTSVVAQSRDVLRNQMVTSMMGRRAGMDKDEYEVGEQDTRLPVDVVQTTAPTSLSPNGFSVLACTVTSAATYSMLRAIPGIYKQITQISSSTGGFNVQFGANANIVSSLGSSFNQLTFAGIGHTASLSCISNGSTLGSSAGGGGTWLLTTTFTTAGGMSASTY